MSLSFFNKVEAAQAESIHRQQHITSLEETLKALAAKETKLETQLQSANAHFQKLEEAEKDMVSIEEQQNAQIAASKSLLKQMSARKKVIDGAFETSASEQEVRQLLLQRFEADARKFEQESEVQRISRTYASFFAHHTHSCTMGEVEAFLKHLCEGPHPSTTSSARVPPPLEFASVLRFIGTERITFDPPHWHSSDNGSSDDASNKRKRTGGDCDPEDLPNAHPFNAAGGEGQFGFHAHEFLHGGMNEFAPPMTTTTNDHNTSNSKKERELLLGLFAEDQKLIEKVDFDFLEQALSVLFEPSPPQQGQKKEAGTEAEAPPSSAIPTSEAVLDKLRAHRSTLRSLLSAERHQ